MELFEISVDSKAAAWLHMCIFLKLVTVSEESCKHLEVI